MLDCNKIDELMMDWLYKELDESSSTRVAEHVHGCSRCAAEASALRRTREAFRDLSPVEPPVAVSAILLHEAARRAPAPATSEEVGFWARVRSWFRPIMFHPAAAAVATLVLVAGIAGTLYVRHGDEMTDTENLPERPMAAAEDPAPAESIDLPVVPEAATAAPTDGDLDRTADVLGEDMQAELSREVAEQRLEKRADDAAKRFSVEKEAPAVKSRKKAAKAKPLEAQGPIANAVSGADPLIDGKLGSSSTGGLVGGGGKGATRGRAEPAPAPTTSSDAKLDFADPGAGESGYRVYKDKPISPKDQAWFRQQESKLSQAVKSKRCYDAAKIANDMLDRNADYYTKRVDGSKAVQPCSMAVRDERSRRASSRRASSKNVGAGQGQSASQKAKAAPQQDDEAAAEAAE
jgi:negative regulator of sigma E activity